MATPPSLGSEKDRQSQWSSSPRSSHCLILSLSLSLWLKHFLHTLAADNKDIRCCTGSSRNKMQSSGRCRSMHLGVNTQGILSLWPDPSRRTRKPPSSGCISARQFRSLIYSSGSGRACTQRAPILAPGLQWLLRVPLDPRSTQALLSPGPLAGS